MGLLEFLLLFFVIHDSTNKTFGCTKEAVLTMSLWIVEIREQNQNQK